MWQYFFLRNIKLEIVNRNKAIRITKEEKTIYN